LVRVSITSPMLCGGAVLGGGGGGVWADVCSLYLSDKRM